MSQKRKHYVIFSDVHYSGPEETRRGLTESDTDAHPFQKGLVYAYRNFLWLADPIHHAGKFTHLAQKIDAMNADEVIYLGDLAMDSAYVGLSDPGTLESARELIQIAENEIRAPIHWVIGDHELGKTSIIGKMGGPRIESLDHCQNALGIPMHWKSEWHQWVLVGVCSTLVGLPVFKPEILDDELHLWEKARLDHLDWLKSTFENIQPQQKIVIFCHDPSALGFMHMIPEVRAKLDQIAVTWVGHMHTSLVENAAHLFSGIPEIGFLGTSIRRYTIALQKGKVWKDFKMRLCPSPAGSEIYRDGGFYEMILSKSSDINAPTCVFHPNPW